MSSDRRALYTTYESRLEDFWGRRRNGPSFEREFMLFGRPALLTANESGVMAALNESLPLFSVAPRIDHRPFTIHLVVSEAHRDYAALPVNLTPFLRYTGYGDWLDIQIGPWGHCHFDLAAARCVVVLTPALAARPDLVSRYLLN